MSYFVSTSDSPNFGELSNPMDSKVPENLIVPSSVDDMFDLAAPPLEMPVVARLVPLVSSLHEPIPIHQDDGVITLGRSKVLPPLYRIDASDKVSSKHCELSVNVVTLRVTLKDISTNGTYINSERLKRGVVVSLNPGDHVSLTRPLPASPSGLDTQSGTSSVGSVEFIFQRLKNETTVDLVLKKFTCAICNSVYLRPCSVLPCMHVFCGSCISQRLRQQHFKCVVCHMPIDEVQLTHKVQSGVEQLLAAAPIYRRSAEEEQRLEALDDIPATGRVVLKDHKRQRDDGDDHIHSDDEEGSSTGPSALGNGCPATLINPRAVFMGSYGHATATPDSRCRQCQVASTVDGFQCMEGTSHLTCQACRTRFPERPLCGRPQKCHLCSIPFCNLYFGEEGGCPAVGLSTLDDNKSPVGLRPLSTHAFSSIPPRAFAGNTTEQAIFSAYLSDHNISVSTLWDECIGILRDGKWRIDLTILNGPVTAEAPVCSRCAESVFSSLLFIYRNIIPTKELPESVTERPNCWDGINCSLQFQKAEHAKTYNHVCYQVKRKE
ncbi:unnamed protein product [Phytomonas sp. EM1]|nr:unnamed protein product [Phytomonas sp. EM1]|eukprot:CCW62218.1 unnamed protein product [Phytomonas sp. isolate EM1]